MFVTHLSMCNDDGDVIDPDWDMIKEAIMQLDGDTCTDVGLSTGVEVPHMIIAGGDQRRYVAYVTFDNEIFHTLTDENAPDAEISLVCGGQEGEYAARLVVGLPQVLSAAEAFYKGGELASDVTWTDK